GRVALGLGHGQTRLELAQPRKRGGGGLGAGKGVFDHGFLCTGDGSGRELRRVEAVVSLGIPCLLAFCRLRERGLLWQHRNFSETPPGPTLLPLREKVDRAEGPRRMRGALNLPKTSRSACDLQA